MVFPIFSEKILDLCYYKMLQKSRYILPTPKRTNRSRILEEEKERLTMNYQIMKDFD